MQSAKDGSQRQSTSSSQASLTSNDVGDVIGLMTDSELVELMHMVADEAELRLLFNAGRDTGP